jgi:hypothetical protein
VHRDEPGSPTRLFLPCWLPRGIAQLARKSPNIVTSLYSIVSAGGHDMVLDSEEAKSEGSNQTSCHGGP